MSSTQEYDQGVLRQLTVDQMAPEILNALILGSVTHPQMPLSDALVVFPSKLFEGRKLDTYLQHITPMSKRGKRST